MDKKKERSSKQKLRVEVNRGSGLEDGNLMLANPMAGGELSHRVALGTTHQNVDQVQAKAFVWKKNRPKSPSLLRFFVRGTRKTSEDIDDSTSSDHEDGLSSHSQCSLPEELPCSPTDNPFRFNRNVAAYVTMPRRKRRVEKRDSGFHSERSDSTSQDKDTLSASPDDMQSSSVEDRPVGMEALEALHNQIQILVKQDCPEEDTQLTNLHDAVIASLRYQLEEMQQTLEFLRSSDHNLRLALRDAEHRALEAETKLFKCKERNQHLERNLLKMAHKYQQHLTAKETTIKSLPPKPLAPSSHHVKTTHYYSPQLQRVQRDIPTGYPNSMASIQRPSSAQTTHESISSVETCV